MNLLVIHEVDHDDKEADVIGVADSVESAQKVIDQYYGKHSEVSFNDIRDSNLEWSKVLLVSGCGNEHFEVTVTLEWFKLNVA